MKLCVKQSGFLFALVIIHFFQACSSPNTLLFEFPDGFQGIVRLRGYEDNGLILNATNGVVVLPFPKTGVLTIKGELPTTRWHCWVARYEGGQSIPVATPDSTIAAEIIALRSVGGKNKEEWFVVGTYEDLKAAIEKRDGFKWPSTQ